LIHWNAAEAQERIARLRAAGYEVEHRMRPGSLRQWRDDPPAAFVIDLSRLPSHGRDVALSLRGYKPTRSVPLVFVEGEPDKVERVKRNLPDASYTTWSRIRSSLKQAIARPPADPVVPEHNLAGYSGTPLPKKLGIKAGSTVALVGAPKGFVQTLGKLPEGVKLEKPASGRCDLTVWFVTKQAELRGGIRRMGDLVGQKALWIAWPKRASGAASDLTENVVREVGLASGLVDCKVCAIDATWSGLKFTRRKSK
jgi:hypothetical protein